MGRKPTPTALKIIKGNPGKRPLNKEEPKVKAAIPECPDWLSPEGKAEWDIQSKMLYEMGVLTETDANTLSVYCYIITEIRSLSQKLQEHGYIAYDIKINHDTGEEIMVNPKTNPLSPRLEKLITEYKAYSALFGLDPSSRSKITATKKEKVNEFGDF